MSAEKIIDSTNGCAAVRHVSQVVAFSACQAVGETIATKETISSGEPEWILGWWSEF
jgi:hypothetical protein